MPADNATPSKPVYRGTGYWMVQLIAMFVFAVLCAAGGLFLLLAPLDVLSPDGAPRENGTGVMLLVLGLVFAVAFVVMLRVWLRMSKQQRAVYAWVVMQQHSRRTDAHPVNPAAALNDMEILATAKRGRRGELSADEIRALQALRPEVPYPGTMPGPQAPGRR